MQRLEVTEKRTVPQQPTTAAVGLEASAELAATQTRVTALRRQVPAVSGAAAAAAVAVAVQQLVLSSMAALQLSATEWRPKCRGTQTAAATEWCARQGLRGGWVQSREWRAVLQIRGACDRRQPAVGVCVIACRTGPRTG